ncbi:Pet127-domain-containing protein [Rostrohypoxylon terebratum]|nr:Pet127-domain-containing protein [Rostrohypoxylon terebratum]
MLRLSSRNAHHIGSTYVCASCFAATQSARSRALRPTLIPNILHHHGRLLSNTSFRATQQAESSATPANEAKDIAVQSSNPLQNPQNPQNPQKKKKKKGAPKFSKTDQCQPKVPPLTKKAAAQSADARQLQVLQGALAALKNVLASQNINIDQIIKSAGHSDQATAALNPGTKAQAHTKAHTKPKAQAKAVTNTDKSENKEAQDTNPNQISVGENITTAAAPDGETASASASATASTEKPKVSQRERRLKSKAKKKAAAEAAKTATQDGEAKDLPDLSPVVESNDINSVGFATPELRDKFQVANEPTTSETPEKSPKKKSKEPKGPKHQKKKAQKSQKSQKAVKIQKVQSSKTDKSDIPAKSPLFIHVVRAKDLHTVPVEAYRPPVPALSYGLERVLFNPGVYTLQDPRSRVYNFDPYLSEIMPIQEFDFNALKQYVTSSKDSNLIRIAKENAKKYTGSTSSMTSMLSHFHYLLSAWREINSSMLSRQFEPDSMQYTRILRGPAAIFLHWKDGTYAIDADKEFDTANILSMLGKSMEKLLTLTKEEYERYRHPNSDQISEEERNAEEAFHYTSFRDFMMRSQLDAHDPRIPGTGMFDLKTRAVVSIRMDAKGFHKGLGYEIRKRFGQWESFEREYYDMIRSAFLKYSLQVRMGRMDGIFVAFHNTQRIFGFQYIPLTEMDLALHGTSDTTLGDSEYKLSLSLLNDILDRATKKWPEQSLRLHFETRTSTGAPFMYIFAKPVSQADIDEVQNANRAAIEEFERGILGLVKEEAEAEAAAEAEVEAEAEAQAQAQAESEPVAENNNITTQEEDVEETSLAQTMSTLAAWKEVQQVVEDAVDDDEVGVGAVREAIEDALEQSGLLHAKSSSQARGYVDALLASITGRVPSKPAGSSTEVPVEDEIDADEDDSPSIQESEQDLAESSDEISISDNEVDASQIQVDQESTGVETGDHQQAAIEEVGDMSESDAEPSKEHLTTTESPESQLENVDKHGETTLLEQEPITETHVEEKSDSPDGQIVEEPVETAELDHQVLEEEVEEDEDDEEADDVDDELETDESKKDINAAATMSPLRDLIVRMAQSIDEKSLMSESESSMDDSFKLKEFERILGELISRTKDERAHPLMDDASKTAPVGQTVSEAQAETKPTEPEVHGLEEKQDPAEQLSSEEASETSAPAEEEVDENLLGLILTIKNKVNGKYVTRPVNLGPDDTWNVEYNIEEIARPRATTIYTQCKSRRRKIFEDTGDKEAEWYRMFRGKLDEFTQAGRKFRAQELEHAKTSPVHVVGHDKPLLWEDVFGKKDGEKKPAEEDAETV